VAEPGAAQLFDVLKALGYRDRERVSINTALPGKPFVSELHEVRALAGWVPPQDRNVWFGVNPVGRHVRYGRGTEADITRVCALFADLDVKPGEQFDAVWQCGEARLILEGILGIGCVAVIHSGHGQQPLWRIGSPRGDSTVIDRDRSRAEWKDIYQRWGTVVQQAAIQALFSPWYSRSYVLEHPDGPPEAKRKIRIDNVFDLSRVLRCPGSVNWKDPDNPVPVRTEVYDHDGRIKPRDLLKGMDDDGVTPLAVVKSSGPSVPTSFGEADVWIHEQRGATLELRELQRMPAHATLLKYADTGALVELLAGGQYGAHVTMIAKVQHAVYAAQEGRAGLVLALNNIQDAYLDLMERRASGELPGEARTVEVAAADWYRAVTGAVAKARGRDKPVVLHRRRKAYRPAYQPRYRKPWWE
jgi:hypothetical protein